MSNQDSLDTFLIIPEGWANDLAVLDLAGPLGMYLWLSANSYFRRHAENFDVVGPWVKKGLVVARFTHAAFVEHITALGGSMSERTSKRYLKDLIEADMVRVLQRGGTGQNGESVLAVGFWIDTGSRMKIVARGWIDRAGLPPETRRELIAIGESLGARNEATQKTVLASSAKNGTSDSEAPSAKNGTSPGAKNGTSDSGKTPSQTKKSGFPHTAIPIEEEKTTSFLPAQAPESAEDEAPHRALMTVIATTLYGGERNVPKPIWPRIAKASKELRELDPPLLADEAKQVLASVMGDKFWDGKLSLNNLVDVMARNRKKAAGGLKAIKADAKKRTAEKAQSAPAPKFATFQEMAAAMRAKKKEAS